MLTLLPAREWLEHELCQLLCRQVLQPRGQALRPAGRPTRDVQLHMLQLKQAGHLHECGHRKLCEHWA